MFVKLKKIFMLVLKAKAAFGECRFLPRPTFHSYMKCDFCNKFNGSIMLPLFKIQENQLGNENSSSLVDFYQT